MKVSVKDGKDCEKILKIEVTAEAIQNEYEAFYKAVTPKAKIPGFRPGKAPRHVVAMHFKNEARETVLKNLVSDSYRKALQEKSLEPMGYPEIRDIRFEDAHLSYQASFEVRPQIKLARFKGLSAKKDKAGVSVEEVEDALKRIRESLAQFKAVEDRPVAMGDSVIADYVCLVDGKEVEKRTGDWFEVKENEFLQGLSKQMVGLRVGGEKDIEITFPGKMGKPEWAGKQAVFKVKINEIKEKKLPELNDEMAREAGKCETLSDLRNKIEKELTARKEQEAEAAWEKALLEELVKNNKIDLPEKLVNRRVESMLDQARETMARQGAPEGEFEKQKEKMKVDFLPEAKRQVHVAFLLDEIAIKENITVTDEDLKARYAMIADRFKHQTADVEKLYSENEEARESLKDQVRNAKAIEFIKENAKLK